MMVEIKRKIDDATTLTINDLSKDPEIMDGKIDEIVKKLNSVTKILHKE